MSDATPTPEVVAKAIYDLLALTQFAYARGFHEMGYDPLQVVRDEIVRLRAESEKETARIERDNQAFERAMRRQYNEGYREGHRDGWRENDRG